MAASAHIIGKQNIRVRYNGNTDVMALRQQISRVCSDELPVRLNKLFDAYDEEGYVLRIDKLHVEVNIGDGTNLEETLAKAIIEQVESALRRKLEQKVSMALSVNNSYAQALIFYLKKGYLPWWSFNKATGSFLSAFQNTWNASFVTGILSELLPLLQSAEVRVRLLRLMDHDRFETFVTSLEIWTLRSWTELKDVISALKKTAAKTISDDKFTQFFRSAFLEAILFDRTPERVMISLATILVRALRHSGVELVQETNGSLATTESGATFNAAVVAALSKQQSDQSLTPKTAPPAIMANLASPADSREGFDQEEDDSIFISNAGMVILALYLPAFFRNTDLLRDGKLSDIPRAVSLMRHLAYGDQRSDDDEEFEIVLEKLFCGLNLSDSISERHIISAEENEQVSELLQSAIEHWKVLKSTSPDGLRHNFLQREGRLLFRNNQWELNVHKEAHDILLDYLPWNISMIKLPWMPHLMTVKWNV